MNGLRHGKEILYDKSGNKLYSGNFINGVFEGKSKLIYDNGDYYIGQLLNGLRNGQGKLYNKKGKIIYEGEFSNDKYDGKGKIFYEKGDII